MWTPIDANEFYRFLAVLLFAARQKNKLIKSWSPDELLYTPIFSTGRQTFHISTTQPFGY